MTGPNRELAGRQVFAKIIIDWLSKLAADDRKLLEPEIKPGERILGTFDDNTLGSVSRSKPPQRVVKTDPKAFLAWVQENRPDEIVVSVRSSYEDACKRQVKEFGHAFNPATGEVIPGWELAEGNPSYTVTPDDAVRAAVLAPIVVAFGLDTTRELEA